MNHHLLLRLEAPMQAWGVAGRFDDKDTNREPTKSGIVGLLANALGRDRADPIADLAGLHMAVRVDVEGRIESDYRTAGGGQAAALLALHGHDPDGPGYYPPSSDSPGPAPHKRNPVVMDAHYLADASFLACLTGFQAILDQCRQALLQPARPLYLGRKGLTPTRPIPEGRIDSEACTIELLTQQPWVAPPWLNKEPERLRIITDRELRYGTHTFEATPQNNARIQTADLDDLANWIHAQTTQTQKRPRINRN